jgi:hypothetical protein
MQQASIPDDDELLKVETCCITPYVYTWLRWLFVYLISSQINQATAMY